VHLLVTRPQPEAQHFAKQLAAAGHKTVIAPLLEIQAVAEEDADIFASVDALAITSARTFNFLQPTEAARALPVFTVGAATAAAARAAGFQQVEEAAGNAAALASLLRRRLPPGKVVLNPGGRDQARDPSQILAGGGLVLIRRIVYQAYQVSVMPQAATTALDEGCLDAATFFSPRTARAFVRLAQESGLVERTEPLLAFCLSPAVAAGLRGSAWKDVLCAQQPDSAGLLQLIASRACGGNKE